MRGGKNEVKHASGQKGALEREAVAYAIGRTEEWIRQFAEGVGLPFEKIADGISAALAVTGHRAGVPLLPLRGDSARRPEVLQPEVAVGRGARKSVPKEKHSRRKVDGRTVRAIKQSARMGQAVGTIARRLHVSEATVYRYAKAA